MLEEKTAGTILETPKEIKIGDEVYLCAPARFATLIELSRFIPLLPEKKGEDVMAETLAYAAECEFIGEMLAILILGEKGSRPVKKRVNRFKSVVVYPAKELGDKINKELSTGEILDYFSRLLKGQDVVFFWEIITFLREVNLLKKTKS